MSDTTRSPNMDQPEQEIHEILTELKGIDAELVGEMFTDYIAETLHNNWDGWEADKRPGAEALIRDFMLYANAIRGIE